jgi:hypothetical protein
MRFTRRLRCHPLALVEIPLSLCQRLLGGCELFPEPILALSLGLESRDRIGVLSSAQLGPGLNDLTQKLPGPGSPDMSG